MGTGNSGRYSGTRGSQAFPGSSDYMKPGDPFSKSIRNRKDVDVNGFHDVVAHGGANNIMIEHNGQQIEVDHRVLSKLLIKDRTASDKAVRLLSCNTGKVKEGFAQNLANKLNRPVKAPTEYLWARPDGSYFVAGGRHVNGQLVPDLSKPGKFKTYYPKRRK